MKGSEQKTDGESDVSWFGWVIDADAGVGAGD